jgi:hypothetical protein
MSKFTFWASCVDLSHGEIIHYITDGCRSQDITYQTFVKYADLSPLRQANHPAMYRISCPDNWSVSFHKSFLPSGAPIYYFAWSRIEFIFVDPKRPWPNERKLAKMAEQAGY